MDNFKKQIDDLYNEIIGITSELIKKEIVLKNLIDNIDYIDKDSNIYSEEELDYYDKIYNIRSRVSIILLKLQNFYDSDIDKNIMEIHSILTSIKEIDSSRFNGKVVIDDIINKIK